MGLTIHYSLHFKDTAIRKARDAVVELHKRALDLPFERVGNVVELSGDKCNPECVGRDDSRRWLIRQSCVWVEDGNTCFPVPPTHLIGFATQPGTGCEPANFGLCRYPVMFEVRDPSLSSRARRIRTRLSGWRWGSFCKTQYASNPEFGGIKNFLRCHVSVVTLLDHAKLLGLIEEVNDEGEYWQHRDLAELAREVGQWNELIAGFASRLKDKVGSQVLAEIAKFPDFEHLAAHVRGAS